MKYSEIRKTRRYKRERAADGAALTRSAFETLLVFMILLFIAAAVLLVFLNVVSFSKVLDGKVQNYSVITVEANDLKMGDIVSVKTEKNISAGEIIGFAGDKIVIGTDPEKNVNCVQIGGVRYFSYEELSKVMDEFVVPEGYLMLNGDFNSSESLVVGELVPMSYITGKASVVLYPFNLFGRTADYLKK